MKIGLINLSDRNSFMNHSSYDSSMEFLKEEGVDFCDFISLDQSEESVLESLYNACSSDVDLIWSVSGGDKCISLIPNIDWRTISESNKMFYGLSDFTHFAVPALLYGIRCFYGQSLKNVMNYYPDHQDRLFLSQFLKTGNTGELRANSLLDESEIEIDNEKVVGGYLSIFSFMQNCYRLDLTDRYLFLEYHSPLACEQIDYLKFILRKLVFTLKSTSRPKGVILGRSMMVGISLEEINTVCIQELDCLNLPIYFIDHFKNVISFS